MSDTNRKLPSVASMADRDRHFFLYRDQIRSEADWVAHRVNVLLTSNSFLAGTSQGVV